MSALGLSPDGHRQLVEPLLAVSVIVSFGLVSALAVRRRDAVTPLVSGAGAVLVLTGRFSLDMPAMTAIGAALLVAAATFNSALCRRSKALPAEPAA